jgi:diacylglycerol kinase (ATP)
MAVVMAMPSPTATTEASRNSGVSGNVRGGRIAVFVNPQSRANRRNPRLAAEFQAVLGDLGQVLAPSSLAELDSMGVGLREAPPEIIAVHGGDGTLHKVVTALGRAFADRPLPPLAILPGGTMNVVATSLKIGAPPVPFLKMIAATVRAGRPPELIQRRCMRVGEHLGFVFGNGLSANFLGEYYSPRGYSPTRAIWLMARTFFSALVGGPFSRRVFRRFEGTVRVDDATLPRTRFVGVCAATVREVGLGFKLVHRADDDPERFGVLAIHAPPLALVRDLRAVHAGRGIAPARAFSAVASALEIQPMATSTSMTPGSQAPEMSYTIDGDLYRVPATSTLRISVGPRIAFVSPSLLAAASGDTMEPAR